MWGNAVGARLIKVKNISALTQSEQEMYDLYLSGLKNKQIAEKLSIKETTVRNKMSLIRAKLLTYEK